MRTPLLFVLMAVLLTLGTLQGVESFNTTGLVGQWNFTTDETISTGPFNDPTVVGSPTHTGTGGISGDGYYTASPWGSGTTLSWADDTNIRQYNKNFSIGIWVNNEGGASQYTWLGKYRTATEATGYYLRESNTNAEWSQYWNGVLQNNAVDDPPSDRWTHYFVTSEVVNSTHSNVTMYINGTAELSKWANITNTDDGNTEPLVLGYWQWTGGPTAYTGGLDDLVIFNATLAGEDVLTLYECGVNGTRLDKCANEPAGSGDQTNTLTFTIENEVNGSSIAGFCIRAYNGTNNDWCNNTGTTIRLENNSHLSNNTYYNFTFWNITGGLHEDRTYFNETVYNYNFSESTTINRNTTQARFNVTAFQIYTGLAIQNFNATNDQSVNTTTSHSTIVSANNGSNTVSVDTNGNYTSSLTCTGTILSTTVCNATRIHDSILYIGARADAGGAAIQSFNSTLTNTTINVANKTPTTSYLSTFHVPQGYNWTILLNSTDHNLQEHTLGVNNATLRYNFSLLSEDTFELTFYNETTNQPIGSRANITVELISSVFSNNYSTSNGTLIVTLLTPADYTIRYWYDPIVPREYYATLTAQSYQNLSLYIIDTGVSNYYIPVIIDQNTNPIGGATIQLLRAYILTNNTFEYRVVEMAKTNSLGEAVLRVVPNTINYKFIFTKDGSTFTTQPTKFVDTTNDYVLSLTGDPTESQYKIGAVTTSLTFNNATRTYTWTWTDANTLVTEGCMTIDQHKLGVQTRVYDNCVSGSTGSIGYTVTDTNQTTYVAQARLETTTEYSTYHYGPLTQDYTTQIANFGLVGLIIALFVFITFIFIGNEQGSAGAIISGLIAITLMGLIGFIGGRWEVLIGVIIVGGIIIYKVRR